MTSEESPTPITGPYGRFQLMFRASPPPRPLAVSGVQHSWLSVVSLQQSRQRGRKRLTLRTCGLPFRAGVSGCSLEGSCLLVGSPADEQSSRRPPAFLVARAQVQQDPFLP